MKNTNKIRENERDEPKMAAQISLKRMYMCLLKAQEILLDTYPDKRKALRLLVDVEQDLLMMNDEDNFIDRDLLR